MIFQANLDPVCRRLGLDIDDGRRGRCRRSSDAGQIALEAYARFDKGRHPAAPNMDDCFAYACAKALGAELLYESDDFAKTDLA